MTQKSSDKQPKKDEQERAARPVDISEGEQESGPPRALGNQTNMGDQTELDGVKDRSTHKPDKVARENHEELAHSNSTDDYAAYKTKANQRDLFDLQE